MLKQKNRKSIGVKTTFITIRYLDVSQSYLACSVFEIELACSALIQNEIELTELFKQRDWTKGLVQCLIKSLLLLNFLHSFTALKCTN